MATVLSAADALVVLNLLIPSEAGVTGTVPVLISAESTISTAAGMASPVTQRVDVPVGTTTQARLRVAPGVWLVRIGADGFWAPPLILRPTGEAGGARDVRLYRTATVTAPVDGLADARATVLVDFRDATDAKDGVPEGRLECPTSRGHLRCAVPVGVLDLRFEVPGFAPAYRWSRQVRAGTPNPLARLVFTPGASVSGYVRTAEGRPAGNTEVELSSLSGDPIRSSRAGTADSTAAALGKTLRGTTSDRGFFQIRGVPSGDFRLLARTAGTVASTEVRAADSRETRLRDDLILQLPVDLSVSIEPPVSPDGTPWSLRAVRLAPYREAGQPQRVPAGGSAVLRLTHGTFSLEVWKGGERWFLQSVTIDGPPPPVLIRLPITHITGTVSLGADPLPGLVVFGGRNGPVQVSLTVDAEGAFDGTLPHDGDWPVTVQASTPPVERTLARVPVVADASGEAQVAIELPDTRLRGRVVDEAGQPVRAFVLVFPDGGGDRAVQLQVEPPEASFVARGLPPGDVQLEAEGEWGRRSDRVVATLAEGEERETTLVVKGLRAVQGQLLSSDGVPIAGASVLAFEDDLRSSSSRHLTDAAGRFELRLRPRTRHLILVYWADGYATRVSAAAVSPEPLLLSLDRGGGVLTLDFGQEIDLFDLAAPVQAAVSTGSVSVPVALLFHVAASRGALADPPTTRLISRLSIGEMSAGPYALCVEGRDALILGGRMAGPRCVEGIVQPGGEARLALPPGSWAGR